MTPVANANGTGTVTVTVSDGISTAQDSFVFTVNAVNDAPTISDVVNQTTNEDVAITDVALTINDVDTTLSCASSVTPTSSNTTLLPNGNVAIAGTAPNCTVTITPAVNQIGSTTVTLTVSDGTLTAVDTFVVDVTAVNDTPTISNITDKSTNEDIALDNIAFTIDDVDSTLTCVSSVSKSSSNTTLLPSANITI